MSGCTIRHYCFVLLFIHVIQVTLVRAGKEYGGETDLQLEV